MAWPSVPDALTHNFANGGGFKNGYNIFRSKQHAAEGNVR